MDPRKTLFDAEKIQRGSWSTNGSGESFNDVATGSSTQISTQIDYVGNQDCCNGEVEADEEVDNDETDYDNYKADNDAAANTLISVSKGPDTLGLKHKIRFSTRKSKLLRVTPQKMRRIFKIFHNHSVSPTKRKSKWMGMKKRQVVQQKSQTTSVRVNRGLGKRGLTKVNNLKDVINDLAKKKFMSEEALDILERSYLHISLVDDDMKRLIDNLNRDTPSNSKFPEELKSFAMTLLIYSSKAYDYVSKTYHLALPAPSVIRSWMWTDNFEPGFVKQSFESLKVKVAENKSSSKETLCALMLDDMPIRKDIDYKEGRSWGFIDLGTCVDGDLDYAKRVLVLIVVSVNDHWKFPIGYFLFYGLSEKEKANLVTEGIQRLIEIGVTVVSVTCDGPTANFTMANELGADVNDALCIKPYFLSPTTDNKIFIVFDACSLIKLMRDTWACLRVIIDGDGNKIDFSLTEKIFKFQESELLEFGTKLRELHMEWQKQKKKVYIAIQALSESIADALEFLMEDVKHPHFKDAAATIKFIRMTDRLLDLCNSRSVLGKGSKTPLKMVNENYWRPIIEDAIEYLQRLKTVEGVPLHQSRNKSPIKGFIVTLSSMLGIYDEYVRDEKHDLKYFLTYKLGQEHVEQFFSDITSKYGANNFPTAYQFHVKFRKLAAEST